jgi:ferredoxin
MSVDGRARVDAAARGPGVRPADVLALRAPNPDRAMGIEVDPIGCHGHGLCAEMLPELIELDEWGYPILRAGEVPPQLQAQARRAAASCPTLALHLGRVTRPEA